VVRYAGGLLRRNRFDRRWPDGRLLEYYGYDIADVKTYFKNAKQTNKVPIKGVSTDGTSLNCKYPVCDDTEQTIDITQAVSMAPGLKDLFVFVGSSDTPSSVP